MQLIHLIHLLHEEVHYDVDQKDKLRKNDEPEPKYEPLECREAINCEKWVENQAFQAQNKPHNSPKSVARGIRVDC